MDLLWGAGKFTMWYTQSLPTNTCAGEGLLGGEGLAGPSSSDVGVDPGVENAPLAEAFVEFLTTTELADDAAEADFIEAAEALAGWCRDHFTLDERTALAGRLSDPELTFAAPCAADVAAMVVRLLNR